ncbi:MAG: toxin TcdB middle/N-terminal domain-containing protein, partial [Nitrospirota bacterium]|nr:toxin TcdB middle/N-terminal domain-containing protein [Nitrospirota bacterium]
LEGEGLPGVLSEQLGAWHYKPNLGGGRFAESRCVSEQPMQAMHAPGATQLLDLDGDGQLELVSMNGALPGFYGQDDTGRWRDHIPFASLPNIDWADVNLRFLDLTGDGHADVLITEHEAYTWYPSEARRGYGGAEQTRWRPDEEQGPRCVFADGTQTMFLADMCGDGLTDLVRIRNGEVCYWPNQGYGSFGAKVTLGNAPRFEAPDLYDPRRIRLADIDGSGPTDIMYLGRDGAQLYFNRSGNALSDSQHLDLPVATENLAAVQVVDLLGSGTACLVWNSNLPGDAARPVRYIDVMSQGKPHLLIETGNSLGGSTEIEYTPSTRFYVADKLAGTPWITRLPFSVYCVSRVTVRDQWRGTTFSSTYSYHHGCFDGIEREFRGFGRVEQVDVEDCGRFAGANAGSPWITEDQRLFQPPVKTITWFHTGAATDRRLVLLQFKREYFPARYRLDGDFHERELPEPQLDEGLDADEWREALRACKGMVLRQEIYELDIDALTAVMPRHRLARIFSAATHNCRIQRLQPRGPNRHATFLVTESEALSYQYEQSLPEPGGVVQADPRIAHTLTLRVDELGQPLQTIAVGYPRVRRHEDPVIGEAASRRIRAVQDERHLAYTEIRYTSDVLVPATAEADTALRHHRLRLPYEVRSFELAGVRPVADFYFQPQDFAALRLSDHYSLLDEFAVPIDVALLPYHRLPDATAPQRRLVEHQRTLFFDDADDDAAPANHVPFGQHGPRGLKYEGYRLALTNDLLAAIFQTPDSLPDMPTDMVAWELHPGITARSLLDDPQHSGYQRDPVTGEYWRRSGIAGFAEDAARHFYLPERYTDQFGVVTTLQYDPLDLYVQRVTDARRNRTEVIRFDHRMLAPVEMVDANGNHTEAILDMLGQVIAVAIKGKPVGAGWEGDDLDAFHSDSSRRNPSVGAVQAFCTSYTLSESQARAWLARAGSRFVYHFGEARDADGNVTAWAARPAMACTISREIHSTQPGGEFSPLQVALDCSDGSGNVLMKKTQAEPEVDGGPLRWIVNGLTMLNNKGKPVKQYEPFFSERFGCEMPREEGITPILFYDAVGRVVRTDLPDGTYTKVEFSPWHARQFDAGDTVLDSAWYVERGSPDPTVPLPRGIDGALTVSSEFRAAWLAAKSADTPGQTHLDSLGREVITITHNRVPDETARPAIEWSVGDWGWRDEFHLTHTKLDVEGKPLWVRDARGNLVMQYIHPPKPDSDASEDVPGGSVPCYDIAGNLLFQHSMDAGDRWSLNDAAGKTFLAWDLNDVLDAEGQKHPEARLAHTEYDQLHRPLQQWLRLGESDAAVVERFEYRDIANVDEGIDINDARARNLIGQAITHDDPSGRMELLQLSFTGQVQQEERRLTRHTTTRIIDWQGDEVVRASQLETETFTRHTRHDALGRMTLLANWHRSPRRVALYSPVYNARGVLESEDMSIGADWNDGVPIGGKIWRAVQRIAYNAKGQRLRLRHGNGTETRYAYDPRTFRLMQLRTTRTATELPFPGFRSNLSDERVVQQLHYTYDEIGNIAEIEDEAWTPVFFRNQAVEPRSFYVYDALNRLVEATGRESAQFGSRPPGPANESFRVESFPTDRELRQYRQRYLYDSVGNFIAMRHSADGGGWTREYETAEDNNRLLRTWIGGDEVESVRYAYDLHGSMLNLENVSEPSRIRWDWRDMIEGMDLGGGGRAWYAYDIGKQRTRKRIERTGRAVEERLYMGGMELYRRYAPGGPIVEEIETHHLFVDDQRVLFVD